MPEQKWERKDVFLKNAVKFPKFYEQYIKILNKLLYRINSWQNHFEAPKNKIDYHKKNPEIAREKMTLYVGKWKSTNGGQFIKSKDSHNAIKQHL